MRALVSTRDATASVGERIAVDHALVHLDADLRWLEETRERVETATTTDITTTDITDPRSPR